LGDAYLVAFEKTPQWVHVAEHRGRSRIRIAFVHADPFRDGLRKTETVSLQIAVAYFYPADRTFTCEGHASRKTSTFHPHLERNRVDSVGPGLTPQLAGLREPVNYAGSFSGGDTPAGPFV
jgi:hypothetical protein